MSVHSMKSRVFMHFDNTKTFLGLISEPIPSFYMSRTKKKEDRKKKKEEKKREKKKEKEREFVYALIAGRKIIKKKGVKIWKLWLKGSSVVATTES